MVSLLGFLAWQLLQSHVEIQMLDFYSRCWNIWLTSVKPPPPKKVNLIRKKLQNCLSGLNKKSNQLIVWRSKKW